MSGRPARLQRPQGEPPAALPPRLPDFDANAFPLDPGVRLLEASAGTGKTFALAHLVLRLVTRPDEPLKLQELLVVTYTRAAAAELRDRIAQRLQAALALLEEAPLPKPPDAVLQAWLGQQGERRPVRGLLLRALEDLDRADITTIHGFCQRTLQRQALESGLGPAVELEREDGGLVGQVAHDYWQQQVLPLPPQLLAGLEKRGLGPGKLERVLGQLDGDPALELDSPPGGLELDHPLAPQLEALWSLLWERFRVEWQARGAALEQAFCRMAADLKASGAKSTSPYAVRPQSDRVAQVDQWISAQSDAPPYPEVLGLANGASRAREPEALLLKYFHPGTVVKLMAPVEGEGRPLPEAPLLEAIAALVDGPVELALLHGAHWGRRELARRRRRSGRMGFSQLLEALDPGENPDSGGEGTGTPGALIAAVAERYRVALIDEFQDTDPIQWRILEAAFTAPAGGTARHLLVMVGDPKQAIYRFRGGELATYQRARSRAEALYGLAENRRFSPALVTALNALMVEPGLPRSQLPVPPVQACATNGDLLLEVGESPLQLLPLEGDGQPERVAALCLWLLERGLRLPGGPDGERPLEPRDLCLLVARHSQAEELRQALERRHLPSRLVSPGDVFASEGATGLQRLLDALADPGHGGRLRLLAASPLLGWSAAQLAEASPEQWDALADQLTRLALALPRQGLMGALSQVLRTDGLARLSLGGRALADLQQAAELVQEQMHREGLGVAAAADWLRRLRLDPDRRVPEAHQLHSDAADSAIAVVTVHRSKGLEYPVVICPYLWMAPAAPRGGIDGVGRRWRPPGTQSPRLDLHLSPHWGRGRAAAQDHQLAQEQESERLAYVALTRVQHLLVLGWRDDPRQRPNPLASWLLDHAGRERPLPLHPIDPELLPPLGQRWAPEAPTGTLLTGPIPLGPLDTSWRRSSYSSWTNGSGHLPPEASEEGRDTDASSVGSDQEVLDADPAASPPAAEPVPWSRQGPLALFPRGAGPGDALHRMLEHLDLRLPSDHPATGAMVARELARAGLEAALQSSVLEGFEWLRLTPMGGELGAFRLAEVAPEQRLNEMSFDLPLAVGREGAPVEPPAPGFGHGLVTASGLARVFADHPGGLFGEAYAQQLGRLEIACRGFLTGSIDLVFRCGERWWVADWKSNWLGERDGEGQPMACGPAHYGREAMAELMAANHYPLQAHLYLVALHRYLRWRLPGYQPEHHLGGYAYVFLRGVPGPTAARNVPGMLVERPPLGRVLALDRLLREGAP